MYLYTEEVYAEYRAWVKANKKWELDEYPQVCRENGRLPVEERITLEPWMFGLCDWQHDGEGHYSENLLPPDPAEVERHRAEREASGYTVQVDTMAVPLSKQHYDRYQLDDVYEDNLRTGISRRVDWGMVAEYWRDYELWN